MDKHPLVSCMRPFGQKYLRANRTGSPKPKVQRWIFTGKEARLTEYGLGLGLPAIMRQDAGSDRTAIGSYAFELNLNPVDFPGDVVSQKRRRFVKVDDEDVYVGIIIAIPEGAAAGVMRGCNAR